MSKWTMIYDECYEEIVQEIRKTRDITKNSKLLWKLYKRNEYKATCRNLSNIRYKFSKSNGNIF